jgi:hypothetical protein
MGNCSSTSNCNPCGPDFNAINQLATKAGAYARQANTYATNAENSWLEFNALYLGAFAVAPTVDNEGDPLQVGALYWNTVSNTIFAWNGTAWVENGNFNEFTNFSLPSATPVLAANLITGEEYEITVVGTTNWTAIGAPSATVGVRFTKNAVAATGTGTARATRDLVTRFADVINVKDFGAIGDGVADDTAAIQAALDSIPINFGATGKSGVYFPKGQYNISNQLWVKSSFTGLFCDGFATAQIKLTNFSVESAILVRSPFAGGGIFAFSMQNLNVFRDASSTYQIAIILESCNNTHLQHIEVVGCPTALDIRGGVNCHYDTLRLDSFGSTNTTANKGVLELNASSYTVSPTTFTHIFTNSKIGANFTTPYCIKITSIDYITFSNCYFGGSKTGGLLVEGGNLYANYNNNFDNCYFDRASFNFGDAIQNAVTITSGAGQGSNYNKFTDCYFGSWDIGAKIDHAYDPSIEFTGCKFARIRDKAIEISGSGSPSDSSTALVLTGNQFRDIGLGVANASIIDIQDVRQATITGNSFYWDFAGYVAGGSLAGTKKVIAIAPGATVSNISITGNVLQGFTFGGVTFVDFENLGTVGKLVMAGNASNNPTNTVVGSLIGNQPSSNLLMLDWYQEGTFAPVVKFGGANVGLTYAARVGNYTRIGNRMIFDMQIQLSNKGSSVGDMTIEGLPFALSPSGTSTGNLSVSLQAVNIIAGNNVDSLFNTTTTIEARYIDNSGNAVIIDDTHIRNDTAIFVSGSSQVE